MYNYFVYLLQTSTLLLMNVRILRVSGKQPADAKITPALKLVLPSLTDGWRFNFKRHAKNKGFKTFVLVTDETPSVIEGCLIFRMINEVEPYMAFIEIAPHNRGVDKRYDKVAGCLIAYASRLSFTHGEEAYMGWLAFDVLEEDSDNEIKLMNVYCRKYGALRLGQTTTMVISPEAGEKLIHEFLL